MNMNVVPGLPRYELDLDITVIEYTLDDKQFIKSVMAYTTEPDFKKGQEIVVNFQGTVGSRIITFINTKLVITGTWKVDKFIVFQAERKQQEHDLLQKI